MRGTVVSIGLAAVVSLTAGCGGTSTSPSTESLRAARTHSAAANHYVALGSSYASGPGSKPLTDARCGRAEDNYPNLVSRRLHVELTDASCSGATTADIIDRAQPKVADHRQIDAVTADTSLVTLTVGGNNVRYISRVMAYSCQAVGPVGPARVAHCNGSPPPIPSATDYAQLAQNLGWVLHAIRDRAPRARTLVVEYLPIADGVTCESLPLTPDQLAETRSVHGELTRATALAVQRYGAELVRVSQAATGHGICSSEPWLFGYEGPAPYHETPAGKAAIATMVVQALGRS